MWEFAAALPSELFLSFIFVGLQHSGSGGGGASESLPAKNNSLYANDPLNSHMRTHGAHCQ